MARNPKESGVVEYVVYLVGTFINRIYLIENVDSKRIWTWLECQKNVNTHDLAVNYKSVRTYFWHLPLLHSVENAMK